MRCIFANTRFSGKKPVNPAYPSKLITLGDHLRKTRLDRGLSQAELARMLKVTTDSVTGWELNRHHPTSKFAMSIIEFLGYLPFLHEGLPIGKRLIYARLVTGKTQRQVAIMLSCDPSNLRHIELDQRKPSTKTLKKIQHFIYSALACFQ